MPNDKTNRASDIVHKFWEWRLTNAPEYATSVGVHRYDDRLDEMNLNAFARFQEEGETLLDEVKELMKNGDGTSTDMMLNLELIVADLEQLLHGMTFKSYLFPICAMMGPHRTIATNLGLMKKETREDMEKIISRLRQSERQIEETITLLEEGLRIGLVHHEVSVGKCPQMLRDLVHVPVEESFMFKPFLVKPECLNQEEWDRVVDEAKNIILTKGNSSFLKLADFLQDLYIPNTRTSIAITSLPNGPEYYTAILRFHTTTNMSAQEIHDVGMSEVARIKTLMEQVKEEVNFSGTLAEFQSFLLEDSRFNFVDGQDILAHYKNTVKSIEAKLSEYCHVLPATGFDIISELPSIAPSMPMGRYEGPTMAGGRGKFFVNTYKHEVRKKFDALALCLHEAIPGHHLQFALTIEAGSCPDFRRLVGVKRYNLVPGYFAMNTGYIEGWGLYAEYLGEEMGLFSDPYDMFGRLSSEMLRACRLVVDTGMHALGWSRDAAVEYMQENTALGLHQIEAEINRYISFPGQACAYKIGELKIKELRQRAEAALGDRFDVRLFHHVVVTMGPVPLELLERKIDEFIREHDKE